MLKKTNLIKPLNLIFLAVCFSASTVFTYYYFLYTHEYPQGSFSKIATYEADKVFQTRLLVTELANLLVPTIPLIETLLGWVVPYKINYLVLLQIITILFLILLLIYIPSFIEILGCKANQWFSLLILFPISWNYIVINGMIDGAGLYYPYDIPSLTFFCLGVVLFVNKRWFLFYPVFILALLNRESACFISITGFLVTVTNPKQDFKHWLKENQIIIINIFAQASLWFVSRLVLSWMFKNNPGLFFEPPHSMIEFLLAMVRGEKHWAMENPRWFLTIFAGTWIIPLVFFQSLKSIEKRISVAGLLYLISLIFRSNMMEIRVYNELNVMIFAISLSIVFRKVSELKIVKEKFCSLS